VLHSQMYVYDFYYKLGFKPRGKKFFEADIEIVDYSRYTTYYSSDVVYYFKYVNISSPINETMEFQQIYVLINDNPLSNEEFSYQTIAGVTELIIDGEQIALDPGNYSVEINVYSENYRVDYNVQNAYVELELEILKLADCTIIK